MNWIQDFLFLKKCIRLVLKSLLLEENLIIQQADSLGLKKIKKEKEEKLINQPCSLSHNRWNNDACLTGLSKLSFLVDLFPRIIIELLYWIGDEHSTGKGGKIDVTDNRKAIQTPSSGQSKNLFRREILSYFGKKKKKNLETIKKRGSLPIHIERISVCGKQNRIRSLFQCWTANGRKTGKRWDSSSNSISNVTNKSVGGV